MVVSISAHHQLQSLIEIAGLLAAPQSVAVQNLDGTMTYTENSLSISELKQLECGSFLKYSDGLYHTVVVHPGTTGKQGHVLYLYF